MSPALHFIVILIVVFGMVYLLCDLLEQADQLPFWLTPRLAALLVTFFIAIFWILRATRPVSPGMLE